MFLLRRKEIRRLSIKMVDLLQSFKNVQIMANDIPNFVVKAMKRYIELIIFLSLEFLSKGS